MTIFISTRVLMLLIYLSKNGAAVRLCSMRKHKCYLNFQTIDDLFSFVLVDINCCINESCISVICDVLD